MFILYCEGLELVLDIYKKQPLDVFEQLLPYVEKNGTDIDKARIGFICYKLLKMEHPLLTQWIHEIQTDNKRGSLMCAEKTGGFNLVN